MKKYVFPLFLTALLTFWACSNNDEYNEVPSPILTFITQYWPNPVIAEYNQTSNNEYIVEIKDGPGFEFNEEYIWIKVDGNGLPLPQVFLYDQLPNVLYEYLESGSYLNEVIVIEKSDGVYSLELVDCKIAYDTVTEKIVQTY